MPITASIIVEDRVQRDLRRSIRERHTDHLGGVQDVAYLAEANADASATMAARVATIEAQLAAAELAKDIALILSGDYAGVTAQHVSVAEVRAALRALYQTATADQVGRIAGFLLTLTDAQLRTLFNMTQAQVTNLKVRLQAKVDALNVVLTAVGE